MVLDRNDRRSQSRTESSHTSQRSETREEDRQALLDLVATLPRALPRERYHLPFADSVEDVRRSRMERTAHLLRVAGTFDRNDPLWWDIVELTFERLDRATQFIFGDRVFADDSTEILRDARESQSGVEIGR